LLHAAVQNLKNTFYIVDDIDWLIVSAFHSPFGDFLQNNKDLERLLKS